MPFSLALYMCTELLPHCHWIDNGELVLLERVNHHTFNFTRTICHHVGSFSTSILRVSAILGPTLYFSIRLRTISALTNHPLKGILWYTSMPPRFILKFNIAGAVVHLYPNFDSSGRVGCSKSTSKIQSYGSNLTNEVFFPGSFITIGNTLNGVMLSGGSHDFLLLTTRYSVQ